MQGGLGLTLCLSMGLFLPLPLPPSARITMSDQLLPSGQFLMLARPAYLIIITVAPSGLRLAQCFALLVSSYRFATWATTF